MSKTENTCVNESNNGSEVFWREHYEAFQASGLSRAKYCRQHHLVYHRFLYWYHKFNLAHVTTGDDSSSASSKFLPIHIHSGQQSDSDAKALCTLELGTHQRLLIHTPAAIERVLQVLRRNAC